MLTELSSSDTRRVNTATNGRNSVCEWEAIPTRELGENPIVAALSATKILTLCRRASKIHFEMILVPTVLVTCRIRPELKTFYHNHGKSWSTTFVLVVLGACVVSLPWAYAHSIMPYPCKERDVKLGPPDGSMKTMEFKQQGCEVERTLLRHPFKIGLVLIAASLVLTVVMELMTGLMYCIYDKCGKSDRVLNMKRLMWRPLLMFWYSWVRKKIPNLKFSNDFHAFPPLYTPPSVVICWVYLVLILEMVLISAESGHATFGIVLAYAMGELLLQTGNILLSASDNVEVVTIGSIRNWVPKGWSYEKAGSMTILNRLHELIQNGKQDLYISTAELVSLDELDVLPGMHSPAPSDRREGDDSMDGVGVITKVYVVDADLIVDVVTGTITALGNKSKFDRMLSGEAA